MSELMDRSGNYIQTALRFILSLLQQGLGQRIHLLTHSLSPDPEVLCPKALSLQFHTVSTEQSAFILPVFRTTKKKECYILLLKSYFLNSWKDVYVIFFISNFVFLAVVCREWSSKVQSSSSPLLWFALKARAGSFCPRKRPPCRQPQGTNTCFFLVYKVILALYFRLRIYSS